MELRQHDRSQAAGRTNWRGRGDGTPHGRAVKSLCSLVFQSLSKSQGLVLAPCAEADIRFGPVEDIGGRGLGMTDQQEASFLQGLAPGEEK